jgi:fluoride exporter
MQKLLWIGMGGALGALARYALSGWVQRLGGYDFPWGTLAVNALGCFLFGVVWALAEDRLLISTQGRLFALTGFLGAFTTFSTYMFESGALLRDTQWTGAALNLLGQNGIGLVAVFLGLALGRLL